MAEAELWMDCLVAEAFEPECGCPQEHWHIEGCCLDIHFEPDGSAHAIAFYGEDGECEAERFIETDSMDEARATAFAFFTEKVGVPVTGVKNIHAMLDTFPGGP